MNIRRRYLFILALTVAAALAAGWIGYGWFWSGPPTYLLVFVGETNTKGLNALPLEGDCRRAVEWDERARTLKPLRPECAPDRKTRLLVVYDVDFAGVRLVSEAYKVASFPYEIDLGRPITALAAVETQAGSAPGNEAVAGIPMPLADNRMRLYAGRLSVEGVRSDGGVILTLDGEGIAVRPGEAWTAARVREESSVSNVRPGPDWETRLKKAFERGHPISRLTIINYGSWEKERVEKCVH